MPSRAYRLSRTAVVLLAVAAVIAACTTADRPRSPRPSPLVARIHIGDRPGELVLDATGLWAIGERSVHRIDPVTDRTGVKVSLPAGTSPPLDVVRAMGSLWIPTMRPGALWRADPASGRVTGRVDLGIRPLEPVRVAATRDALWVACCGLTYGTRSQGLLLRVDPRRDRVTARLRLPQGPLAITTDGHGLWVGCATGEILRVDPATGRVVQRVAPPAPSSRIQAAAAAGGGIWLADTGDEAVRRLDPRTGRMDVSVLAPVPRTLAVGGAGVWAIVRVDLLLARVDERAGRIQEPLGYSQVHAARGVAVGPAAVWVSTGEEVLRIDPRRVAATARG